MLIILHIQDIIIYYKFYNFENNIHLSLLFKNPNVCLLHIFDNFINICQQRYQEVKINSNWHINFNSRTFSKSLIQRISL